MSIFFNLIWVIFILYTLIPVLKQRKIRSNRLKTIQSIEKNRNSRLITMIHRQESLSFLGLPFSRHITIEDSEEILRAIRFTPDDMEINIVLHTPGGLVLAAEQIARAIKRHPADVTVFVPHYAMSGGTLLALAADKIVMDENAVLGPVDPQLGKYPAASLTKIPQQKNSNDIEDETLVLIDIAEKAIHQVQENVFRILKGKMEEDKAKKLAEILTEGRWTHDYPINYQELVNMGLEVSTKMPKEIYELMELYPQTNQQRPSVQYIPIPYQSKEK